MAWGRQVQMIVRTQASRDGGVWTWNETDISQLHLDFDIVRSIIFNNNTADFVVYNAGENTRKSVLQRGSNILFSAGYEDQGMGLLFSGQILDSYSNHIGPDWITTIHAESMRSEDKPFQITPVALSYGPDTPLKTILEQLGATLGLVVAGGVNADFPLPNGFVYAGSVKGALRYVQTILKSNGLALFTDNAELVIYRIGETSDFNALYLSPNTGLLSIRESTEVVDLVRDTAQAVLDIGNAGEVEAAIADTVMIEPKKIEVQSLLLPKARPNGLLTVADTQHDGNYIIETLGHSGNNYDGGFNTTLGASADE